MPKTKNFRYYDIFVAASVAVLIISNLGAMKLIALGPVIVDGGALLFPLAYILGDVMTEVYGYKHTRRAIWVSFTWLIIMIAVMSLVQWLPAVNGAPNTAEFGAVFGFVPRIVAASLLAYLVGEFINSFVLAKMKIRTQGKRMWQRLVASTVLGEALDTVIFCLVAFYGLISSSQMTNYILVGIGFKIAVETVMLPVTYRVIHWLKAREHTDYYDKKTNFTPLSVQLDD
ncbi:transporter [Candidatus Saccharibacteria bacterium]|nr:MAG: transporter [Candidatus Saccharibacteria bacterium]PID99216.1 MAG: transporter [Candidatus Saccharibacteria bacterium]